ncbi:hypothetical protein M5K25_008097 [Dendrobium thyrsiflorum]|uniref:MADS-box domain-containing protein n=1 Tax=Dendrobium thyrsiflorum TaxID=117978 RepID=A0ABD0VEK6_DENTH
MVCFSKRRKGLFKKAEELSVLSGARIGVLAFSQAGKMYCSDAQTLNSLLDPQFNISSEKEVENSWELNFLKSMAGNDRAFWYNRPGVQKMDYEDLQQFDRAIFDSLTDHRFFSDSLQEAQKRMKIKKPPNVLVIHLKRFKYIVITLREREWEKN